MSKTLIVLLIVLIARQASAAHSRPIPPEGSAATHSGAVSRPGPLTVSAAREVSRLVRSWAPEPATSQPVQQGANRQGWIRRHPALFGALVGFGAGCGLGVSQVGGSKDDFFNALDELACPVVGGIGAGIGWGIGWSLSRAK